MRKTLRVFKATPSWSFAYTSSIVSEFPEELKSARSDEDVADDDDDDVRSGLSR